MEVLEVLEVLELGDGVTHDTLCITERRYMTLYSAKNNYEQARGSTRRARSRRLRACWGRTRSWEESAGLDENIRLFFRAK